MKVSSAAIIALTIGGASAFAPSAVDLTRQPSAGLNMVREQNDGVVNLGKAVTSFVAASVLAFSTVNTVLPVEAAMARGAAAQEVKVDPKTAKKLAAEKAKEDAEKAAIAKMGKEEKELYLAKKSLAMSQASLKEYNKFVSDSKGAESKAAKSLKAQEKATENAKASLKAASQKLNVAKKQKMPTSAVRELSDVEAAKKADLNAEEGKLKAAVTLESNAVKSLKDGESAVKKAKDTIKKDEKRVKKAEKEFAKFQKNEKKAKAQAAKALEQEKKKLQKLEQEAKKLKDKETATEKELAQKAKALEAERKAIEKMQSKN